MIRVASSVIVVAVLFLQSPATAQNPCMPFVAETSVSPVPLTCLSRPAGCFTEQDSVFFGYVPKAAPGQSKPPTDLLGAARALLGGLESRVEVLAWLRPHAHLVSNENGKSVDVTEETAVNIEKTATFLSYDYGDEATNTTMIFGPRTCNEDETLRLETTATALARVVSIELVIGGPPEEVAALKKKVNRKALEALLGPIR